MPYTVRTACMADLPRILEIYAYARQFMAQTGNPHQWGKTNPPREVLEDDISRELLHIVEEKSIIRGVFFFSMEEDPTYIAIYDGRWESNAPYGTIHRIASDGSGGILRTAMEFCTKIIDHVRIDTHHDNIIMQKAVANLGFERSGIIHLANGSPRIAYEWSRK